MLARLTLLVLALAAAEASPALAQASRNPSWPEIKCARYKTAWSEVLTRRGRQGLGQDFIRSHEAFLESGCTARADVCPRSAEEMDTANILTIAAMNAGMASTFLPFACRK
jgi:hypothetical protein